MSEQQYCLVVTTSIISAYKFGSPTVDLQPQDAHIAEELLLIYGIATTAEFQTSTIPKLRRGSSLEL